jgi:hypothetical protein
MRIWKLCFDLQHHVLNRAILVPKILNFFHALGENLEFVSILGTEPCALSAQSLIKSHSESLNIFFYIFFNISSNYYGFDYRNSIYNPLGAHR